MKRTLLRAALGTTLLAGAVPAIAADVGVSISVGQPGYYGRIDIGNHAPPQVLYRQPVLVQAQPIYAGPPAYLRVPPGHARHWSRHCGRYDACGQQVYFVRDDWYQQVYAPRYRQEHEWRGGYGRGWERRGNEGHGHQGRGHEGHSGEHGEHGGRGGHRG